MQGKVHLDRFVSGFMTNKSPYRVVDEDGKIIGFSTKKKINEDDPVLHHKFEAISRKEKSIEAELLANLNKISKFYKREELNYKLEDDRTYFEKVFSNLLPSPPEFTQTRTSLNEIQFKPTKSELSTIIKNFSELEESSPIINAGFIYKDGTHISLSGRTLSTTHEFALTRKSDQFLSADVLLDAINNQRKNLLHPLTLTGNK